MILVILPLFISALWNLLDTSRALCCIYYLPIKFYQHTEEQYRAPSEPSYAFTSTKLTQTLWNLKLKLIGSQLVVPTFLCHLLCSFSSLWNPLEALLSPLTLISLPNQLLSYLLRLFGILQVGENIDS